MCASRRIERCRVEAAGTVSGRKVIFCVPVTGAQGGRTSRTDVRRRGNTNAGIAAQPGMAGVNGTKVRSGAGGVSGGGLRARVVAVCGCVARRGDEETHAPERVHGHLDVLQVNARLVGLDGDLDGVVDDALDSYEDASHPAVLGGGAAYVVRNSGCIH